MIKKFILLVVLAPSAALAETDFEHLNNVYMKIKSANKVRGPKLYVLHKPYANAYSSSAGIGITTGMMKQLKNDDEVARVLSHELAHWTLHHSASSVANEFSADKLGSYYSFKAGYNVCNGMKYLIRRNDMGGDTHPPDIERARRICK